MGGSSPDFWPRAHRAPGAEMSLFLYGTLRHLPLLEIVLGHPVGDLVFEDVGLADYLTLSGPDSAYPIITPQPGWQSRGVKVSGLTETDIERLNYYEGGFGYELRPFVLTDGDVADVYMPPDDMQADDDIWSLEVWTARWAELTCFAAEEVMSYHGKRSSADVAKIFPRIRARAASCLLAQSGRHGANVMRGKLELIERSREYSGFFAFDRVLLKHERFDGGTSDLVEREVFVGTDAAIVLPYDPERDRVLLVEQIRMGPLARQDPVLWQMEPVAGLVDPGETPRETARREAMEEAGLTFRQLEPVAEGYASPGASTDFFHVFVGICDLPDTAAGEGGVVAEGEDIRAHVMPFDDLLSMAEDRQTANTPLTLLTYWLAHHRARLRAVS